MKQDSAAHFKEVLLEKRILKFRKALVPFRQGQQGRIVFSGL
jgi:hypothetical protein